MATSQKDAPEVSWRTASKYTAEVTWRGTSITFEMVFDRQDRPSFVRPRHRAVYGRGNRFPDAVYVRAMQEAFKAMTQPALREEMMLRQSGKLTDEIIGGYMAKVWAYADELGYGIDQRTAMTLTTKVLENPSPGIIKAVVDALLEDQKEQSGKGSFDQKVRAAILVRRAIAQKKAPEPELPLFSAAHK